MGIEWIHYTATKSKETRSKILAVASKKDSGMRQLINKSLIPTFGSLAKVHMYMPKVGSKLLLVSYLLPEFFCLLLPESYSLFPYFLFLYSESL